MQGIQQQVYNGTRSRNRPRKERLMTRKYTFKKRQRKPGPPSFRCSITADGELIRSINSVISQFNVRDFVQAMPIPGPNILGVISRSALNGCPPCSMNICKICDGRDIPYINKKKDLPPLNCRDRDCVYAAFCCHPGCNKVYIGETKMNACQRITGHFNDRNSKIYGHTHDDCHHFVFRKCCSGHGHVHRTGAERIVYYDTAYWQGYEMLNADPPRMTKLVPWDRTGPA